VTSCLLAIAEAKNGNRAAAQEALAQAKQMVPKIVVVSNTEQFVFELLLAEAEEVLAEKQAPPAPPERREPALSVSRP
jgi:hypothetical protein